VARIAAPLRRHILKFVSLKRPFTKQEFECLFTLECDACVRKCICSNRVKRWRVRRVDCIADWYSCSCGKRHFSFVQLSEAKFRCRTPLYHKPNAQYQNLGRRKIVPGRWRQVVDRAEVKINLAFIDSFNDRIVARALYNRHAEHCCSQTLWNGSENLFEYIL
jgi:hypothetical protein